MIFLVFQIGICLDADQDPEIHPIADPETKYNFLLSLFSNFNIFTL